MKPKKIFPIRILINCITTLMGGNIFYAIATGTGDFLLASVGLLIVLFGLLVHKVPLLAGIVFALLGIGCLISLFLFIYPGMPLLLCGLLAICSYLFEELGNKI